MAQIKGESKTEFQILVQDHHGYVNFTGEDGKESWKSEDRAEGDERDGRSRMTHRSRSIVQLVWIGGLTAVRLGLRFGNQPLQRDVDVLLLLTGNRIAAQFSVVDDRS